MNPFLSPLPDPHSGSWDPRARAFSYYLAILGCSLYLLPVQPLPSPQGLEEVPADSQWTPGLGSQTPRAGFSVSALLRAGPDNSSWWAAPCVNVSLRPCLSPLDASDSCPYPKVTTQMSLTILWGAESPRLRTAALDAEDTF